MITLVESQQASESADSGASSLYKIESSSNTTDCFIFSSPESREICNEPLVLGSEYTKNLRLACGRALASLKRAGVFKAEEVNTSVLHILRGGLNFGLREALTDAFSWNLHSCSFLSAQREVLDARRGDSREDWKITEDSYLKLVMPPNADIVFGDVVATGTSLKHACQILQSAVDRQAISLRSACFFTIGGIEAELILEEFDAFCRERFPGYQQTTTVYLEGRFGLATSESPLRIKLPGTDLLRRDSLLAPEFIESQYERIHYPLERCTIYDAGSRAFSLKEYLEDVLEYWEQCRELVSEGVQYKELLEERMPELDSSRLEAGDLAALVERRLAAIHAVLNRFSG